MEAVLGDGLGSEIHNWLEACVARTTIRNAGEFNGFLKPRERLLTPPMPFRDGSLHLPSGYRPVPDPAATDRFTIEKREFFQRSEEHTSELQSLMRISYAVFCLKKKKTKHNTSHNIVMPQH